MNETTRASAQAREATRFSLADFVMSFGDDPLVPDAEFTGWRAATAWATSCYQQRLLGSAGPRCVVEVSGVLRPMLNLTSYNYLGMADDPAVVRAACAALERYGTGTCGSPMVSGLTDLHERLSARLSRFLGRGAALLFNSGYCGVLGVTAGLMRKGDVVVADARVHISVIEGARMSGARLKLFAHNDPEALDTALRETDGQRRVVMVEGVYSLDGDMADLPALVPVCRAHVVGLIVDEAHSVLTCGETGRGAAEHHHLDDAVGLYYGTFSKAFGGVGGFAAGAAPAIDYLRHYANAYAFSCALPAPTVAALLAVLDRVETDPGPRQRLKENALYFRTQLQAMGVDIGASTTHVVPIIVGSDRVRLYELAATLRDRGLLLVPFDYPSVPEDGLRFRACITASHTRDDLDEALDILERTLVPALARTGRRP